MTRAPSRATRWGWLKGCRWCRRSSSRQSAAGMSATEGDAAAIGGGSAMACSRCGSLRRARRIGKRRIRAPLRRRLSAMTMDEVEIAEIDDEAAGLAGHEGPAPKMDRIDEADCRPCDAEIPEGVGHHALARPLALDPLHDEAHEEHALADEAHRGPDLFGGHRLLLAFGMGALNRGAR